MAGENRLSELARSLGERLELDDESVAVALSGGPDSAALLWLVSRRLSDVVAVHVFHGLDSSAWMATAAGQVAAACGVPMEMVVVEPSGSGEDDLRQARLPALTARAAGRPVLLGHTADDQAETVVMRILRGTGIDGLAGIAVRRGPFRHPMLGVRRSEARELAELVGLPFRDDPANADPSILRNRIRSGVLPALATAADRDPVEAITRLAGLAAEESSDADRLAERIPVEVREGAVRVARGALLACAPAVAARVVRRALVTVAGPYPPGNDATSRILDVVGGRVRGTEVTPGLRASVHGPYLLIERAAEDTDHDPPGPVPVADGVVWAGWRFRTEAVSGPLVAPLSPRRIVVPGTLADRLVVRAAGADDRVTGRRVSFALADAGIRPDDRRGWPVVLVDGDPGWLPGIRARSWSTATPGGYLEVVASREPSWQTSEP